MPCHVMPCHTPHSTTGQSQPVHSAGGAHGQLLLGTTITHPRDLALTQQPGKELSWEHPLEIFFLVSKLYMTLNDRNGEFLHTDKFCSLQCVTGKPTGVLFNAAQMWCAKHLRGSKMLLATYMHLLILSYQNSYLIKSFVVGPFLLRSRKIPSLTHSHLTPPPTLVLKNSYLSEQQLWRWWLVTSKRGICY